MSTLMKQGKILLLLGLLLASGLGLADRKSTRLNSSHRL